MHREKEPARVVFDSSTRSEHHRKDVSQEDRAREVCCEGSTGSAKTATSAFREVDSDVLGELRRC